MIRTPHLALGLSTLFTASVLAAPLPVRVRQGADYVEAAGLEREAGIVIKRLPGSGQFVACGQERCATVQAVLNDGAALLVAVAELVEKLDLTASFDESRRQVALLPLARGSAPSTGLARVGSMAPNLRLTRLDGRPVALDEFRGQRVLINSWASW